MLCTRGSSLHAATRVGALDPDARLRLFEYILRPPVANERLQILASGLVRVHLKKPFRDGTVAVDLDPLSLLCRLAASVPAPKFHLVRYAGVLASAHAWRSLVVPPPPDKPSSQANAPAPNKPTHRCRWRPWAELLKRTFAADVETCTHCGGRMKLLAHVTDLKSLRRYLTHLGEPTEPIPLSPPRAPPYFKTSVRIQASRHDFNPHAA